MCILDTYQRNNKEHLYKQLMKSKYTGIDGGDTITKYFKEVRKLELLTPEEEVNLAIRIQNGDERAVDELVRANLKFVVSIAKDYQGQGILFADLISEGNYGLIKAAQRFDHTKGFRFITYAVWWIKQSIMQCLNDNGRMIRLPVNVISELSTMRKQMDKFEFENERLPVNNELLKDGESFKNITTPSCTSLNNLINEDGDELLDFIADESLGDVISGLDNERLGRALEQTLEILDERERQIIECYFGLNSGYEPMTLEEIGDKYGLTKERIRQIKEKAIKRLHFSSAKLRKFLNN